MPKNGSFPLFSYKPVSINIYFSFIEGSNYENFLESQSIIYVKSISITSVVKLAKNLMNYLQFHDIYLQIRNGYFTFTVFQFNCCPLFWICHSRGFK